MIRKLTILVLVSLIGIVYSMQMQPYTIKVNQNVNKALRESVQLIEPFRVGDKIHCGVECNIASYCSHFSLNVRNYCSLFNKHLTLFDLVPEYKTSVYSKSPLKYCSDPDNYYPDMTHKVCKAKNEIKSYGSLCTSNSECSEAESLECLQNTCQCLTDPYKLWDNVTSSCRKINENVITNGLIHSWPISNSLIDTVGGKNMTIEQNGQLAEDRFGHTNSALFLNNGYATVPAGVYFNPETGGFTIMAWIMFNVLKDNGRLIDFGVGKTSENILIKRDLQNNMKLVIYDVSKLKKIFSPKQIQVNQWFHFAATVKGTNLKTYENGVLTNNISLSVLVYNNVVRTSCNVGGSNWTSNLNGYIDELKIYDIALSLEEINAEINKNYFQ